MQWTTIFAPLDFGIRSGRLFQCQIFSQGHNAQQSGSKTLQPREVHLRKLDRGNFARAQQFGQLRNSCESKIIDRLELWQLNFAEAELCLCAIQFLPCPRWMESDSRLSIERHIDLAYRLVVVEQPVDARKRHCFLGIGVFKPN